MMSPALIQGLFAAVNTPRDTNGVFDSAALRNSLEFLLERGITRFVLNGATGEYVLTTPKELHEIVAAAAQIIGVRARFLCGVGSASLRGCLENAKAALDLGASGILLPMPYFFPYAQDDLEAFCREAARRLPVPILLYNLPNFTSGLAPATVRTLIADCPNIVGIKDSSGNLEILRMLSASGLTACRVVGSDRVIGEALREGLCDGAVSGIASVMPELLLSVFEHSKRTDSPEFRAAVTALDEFIAAIAPFPVPWGLKWIAETRGICAANFALPVSPRRAAQARELQEWFRSWRPELVPAVR
ncbi:MAG TPA: dihydrodipicolinate synthase family protein [Bryobacteraceae bacterium]|nr:dihydrodipicolinate synthase family protein [Bryobacteraceae bacterium]